MPDILHAWVCGEYVGRFERDAEMLKPRFVSEPGAHQVLSLSLPPDGPIDARAPQNFLDAMIPERGMARERLRAITQAHSASTWDLLAAIGGDLPGGVVLHPREDGPEMEEPYILVSSAEAVAARIGDIKAGGTGFEDGYGSRPRFSLAGAQGKFAIADINGQLFWSDSASPSTHIIKPETKDHAGLELIEAATLALARKVGVNAPGAAQRAFGEQTAFQIERFDRELDADGIPHRLHAEDLTQALGWPLSEKYEVDADEVMGLFRRFTGDNELGYAFYRQYAFNTLIGNSDAHAKNYSIIHRDGEIQLSPLYDAIPIGLFPEHSQSLAMPVGFENHYLTVTPQAWIESAQAAGLDPSRVLSIVQEVADGIREHLDDTLGGVLHARVTQKGLSDIRESADRQTGVIPVRSAMPKTVDLKPAQGPPG